MEIAAITHALHVSPDCVAAHIARGRLELLLGLADRAEYSFQQALRLNPRANIRKELGWLHLESENYPLAISMLTDHLARHSSDYEAFNLLLKCFYMTDRYEAGENVAKLMVGRSIPSDCFSNNGFLCKLLNGGYDRVALQKIVNRNARNPFFKHNLLVATEEPRSWSNNGVQSLKSKLIFQEFRFGGRSVKPNQVAVRNGEDTVSTHSAAVITFGRSEGNDFRLGGSDVSRRHAALVNVPGEVWLYDLGSTTGTRVDRRVIKTRVHLAGVHAVQLGQATVRIAARDDLLV